jgi:phosphoribosylaminoimidazole carboxylase PurE protein
VAEYAASAAGKGVKVIIAGAGMSAALAGAIASRTPLPVIGVAIPAGPLAGLDALVSTVQMPPGVPVACAGLGEAAAVNAAVLAAEILALSDPNLSRKLVRYKANLAEKTLAGDQTVQEQSES